MNSEQTYQLVIVFDQNEVDITSLISSIQLFLDKDVTPKFGSDSNNNVLLTIEGSLTAVDQAHAKILKYYIQPKGLNFFRLMDTAGDEIRQRAYPILSDIEQELRSFINKCLINTFNFKWWASLGEIILPGNSASFQECNHHPLELMTFEELVSFITREMTEWEIDRPILLKDLLSTLKQSESLSDFQRILEQKVQKNGLAPKKWTRLMS